MAGKKGRSGRPRDNLLAVFDGTAMSAMREAAICLKRLKEFRCLVDAGEMTLQDLHKIEVDTLSKLMPLALKRLPDKVEMTSITANIEVDADTRREMLRELAEVLNPSYNIPKASDNTKIIPVEAEHNDT